VELDKAKPWQTRTFERHRLMRAPVPFGLRGAWPLQFRNFIVHHLEGLFILLVVAIVGAVFYLFPYKIAFLNFFYLPVLSAAYFLGKRKAVMGAVLCFLSGVLFAYYRPGDFAVQGTRINAFLVLATWGGFLILASASYWIAARKTCQRVRGDAAALR
jgi:hypothetical protein